LLDNRYAIDRFLIWLLIPAFLLLAIYGSLSGITRELLALGNEYPGFNIADFPHVEALGLGSWIVLGLLILTMLLSYWERHHRAFLFGALAVLSAIVPLVAGRFEYQIATATAWRWFAALFLIGGSLVIWYRRRISERLITFGWPTPAGESKNFVRQTRSMLLALSVVPLILLTLFPACRAVFGMPVQNPLSGVFSLIDNGFSYGVPLVLVGLVLIGYALRERMPAFAQYAGVCFNATVTLALLLTVVSAHASIDGVVFVRVLQLNAITCAVYLLPWLGTRSRWQTKIRQEDQRFAGFLLKLQLFFAVALNAALLVHGLISGVFMPDEVGAGTFAIGSSLGWLSLLTAVVAAFWLSLSRTIRLSAFGLAALLLSAGSLTAIRMSIIGGDAGLHTLTVCVLITAWMLFAAAELTLERSKTLIFPFNFSRHVFDFDRKWQPACRVLVTVAGLLVLFLSFRALIYVEASPWWTIGPLLAITMLAAVSSWRTKMRAYVFAAGLLFYLSVLLWSLLFAQGGFHFNEFLLVNLIANSFAGVVWIWLDMRARQSEGAVEYYFSFHNFTAIFVLGVLALFVLVNFYDVNELQQANAGGLTWLAIASVLVLLLACLRDRYAKYAVAGLYTLGLVTCAFALQQLQLSPTRFGWSVTLILSAFTLSTALLWHWRARLISIARQFGVPERINPDATQLKWLSGFTILAVTAIAVLAYCIDLTFEDFSLRASAAAALAVQFLTFGLLAEGRWARAWRRVGVAVLVTGVVLFGWSWLTPLVNGTWLNRSVILMIAVFGLTGLYGLLLDKANARFPDWTTAARACVPWVLGAGVLALFFCLATEVRYQLDFGAVLVHPVALVAVAVTLVAAVVIPVLFALSPNHDPLGLNERERMRYVYAAEVMLALLFLHVRLTMPWLFTGFIERYWPLVVMLIAYFGVVTSEALRRRQLLVLAEPLERTGAFIPLLPVLGFWIISSEVDFSMLLFIVGGLYGLLSILRRSFLFGIAAAVAGNAGLWYAFQRTDDYQFFQHPQLWLVPVAVSVLIAAYLNEEKLSEDQMTGVRYLSLVTIYVSSTADIFINGVANSPWLPLILGSFSLAGVFSGILFRIRGLLLLGSIFLLLSIVTMIWYASANFGWTWLWYVAGIVTGATIIFMFAVFEKKRSEVLRVVDGLKEWDR
jgi:hypothetical protein